MNSLFHIWVVQDDGRSLRMLRIRPAGGSGYEAAAWLSRQAAQAYAKRRWQPFRFMVMQCRRGDGLFCAVCDCPDDVQAAAARADWRGKFRFNLVLGAAMKGGAVDHDAIWTAVEETEKARYGDVDYW